MVLSELCWTCSWTVGTCWMMRPPAALRGPYKVSIVTPGLVAEGQSAAAGGAGTGWTTSGPVTTTSMMPGTTPFDPNRKVGGKS